MATMYAQAHFAQPGQFLLGDVCYSSSVPSWQIWQFPQGPHQGPAAAPVRGVTVSGESSQLSGFHGNGCSFLPVSWLQRKTNTPKRRQWQRGGREAATGPFPCSLGSCHPTCWRSQLSLILRKSCPSSGLSLFICNRRELD